MSDIDNLYNDLVNFYNVDDENFKEFMAKMYDEMKANHADIKYIKEHLAKEIEKKLEKYLVDGKFNINIEEKVNEFLNNSNVINDINTDINNLNSQLDTKIRYVNTVAELKTKDLKVNEIIKTLGYYSVGDGGSSKYVIIDDVSIIANDIDIILLNNGLKAQFVYENNNIEVKQFGVKEGLISETSDRLANKNRIQRCIDYCLEKHIDDLKINGYYRVKTETDSGYAFTVKPAENDIKSKLNIYVNGFIQAYNCSVFLIENLTSSTVNINLKYGGSVGNEESTTGVQFYNCRNLDIKINGDNFAGTLVRMGSASKPVNESTCSIDCYGGYRCLIHGEVGDGRQQFFGIYSHIFYDNTTKGSIIYNSDDVHFLHFENRFIGSDNEHSLQIINSTVRFTYLGLGERGRFLVYVKGDEGSVCTATIDKYYCANKANAYGLALEGFVHCNVGYLEDSGCKIIVDIRNPLPGSFINIDTFMTKKLKNDRVCVRDRGTDKGIEMRGGSYKLIL